MNKKDVKWIKIIAKNGKLENRDVPKFFKARFLTSLLIPLFFSTLFILPILSFAQIHPLYNQANKYYQEKKFDSALIIFNQILFEYPHNKEAYYNRGLCLYRLNKYEPAAQDFDSCLRLDNSFNDARYMKGLALQKEGKLQSALNEFKKTGNKNFKQRIKWYQLSVLISKNWYYMVAIMFIIILFFAIVAKGAAYKRS